MSGFRSRGSRHRRKVCAKRSKRGACYFFEKK